MYSEVSMDGIYSKGFMDQTQLQSMLEAAMQRQQEMGTQRAGEEKTFKNRLEDRRKMIENASATMQPRFASALDTNREIPLNPKDVFGAFNSFQDAAVQKAMPDQEAYDKARTATTEADKQYTSGIEALMQLIQGNRQLDISQQNADSTRISANKTTTGSGGYATIDPETGKQIEVDSMTAVNMQGGSKLLEAESSVTAKKAKADAIMALGGVKKYLENATTNDLFTTEELTKMKLANELMMYAGNIVGATKNKDAPAVGTLGKFRFGPLVGKEGASLRADIGQLSSEKMKELSGAAISEQEMKRLTEFLPTRWDDENNIQFKSERLFNGLSIGLKMAELAKRNNLTLNEAYVKFAGEVYPQYGESVPAWINKQASVSGGKTNSPKSIEGYKIEVE